MRYAFIKRYRHFWPITVQCRVLNVSVSGYHAHQARLASNVPRRHLSDKALLVHIRAIRTQTRGPMAARASCERYASVACVLASSGCRV